MQNSMCPFCEEQKNRGISIINKSRILAETDNFVVFPTTGGFVENYQLIVPKNHINCFGELSKEQLVELKSIILWQQEINRKYFNSNSSMFEHGALHLSNESGKSIVHAHLHIFPNNISLLDEKYSPDGYNVGLNCGESAGQSVMHIHMHLIPRYKGDVENPRGGVRGVIPNKKNY